jgi:hypothetical protein
MPVNSTSKTKWEDQVRTFYLLDPDTGEPVGSASLPLTVMASGDEWEVVHRYGYTVESEWFAVVPEGEEWQILYMAFVWATVPTDAGDRQIMFRVNYPTVPQYAHLAIAGDTQPENTSYNYVFAPGAADLAAERGDDFLSTPLPNGTILSAGEEFGVYDHNGISANDSCTMHLVYAKRSVS